MMSVCEKRIYEKKISNYCTLNMNASDLVWNIGTRVVNWLENMWNNIMLVY